MRVAEGRGGRGRRYGAWLYRWGAARSCCGISVAAQPLAGNNRLRLSGAAPGAVWKTGHLNGSLSRNGMVMAQRVRVMVSVLALAAFAHAEDVERWTACGIHAIVAKLAPQTELLDALSSATAIGAGQARFQPG